ncbi:MAG: TraB/GumN family protein [Methanocalculus sp. MSAO_Arc1]|uniref:TraB/GumN family protein n=1 Tax=Methanocalculus TaxID=71151 RepID=UPI000FEE5ED3|nr:MULTISPECIES: TraB/GumN family protein [unclassified Methanocalculus]MCP1663066.1 pheromone shutdown-related protein TraB [Methanocalculus sp. AMF5]RQD81742.1 MAG: TraB/GumN family protein [Methanocalculus sp. MSAO_Arc1]
MGELQIVGTAHVSQKSIDDVTAAIAEFQPDIIAVELDAPRYAALKQQEESREGPGVSEILTSGNMTQLLIQWVLAYVQRKIGMNVGIEPGAEMKEAIRIAEAEGIRIALIDRDIRITLSRFWTMMTLREKCRMLYALAVSVTGVSGEEIDIDSLTEQDVVTLALEEFRKFAPNAAKALIDERDAYLAHNLIPLSRGDNRVLAVLGAGHVRGVSAYLEEPETLPPIHRLTEQVKKPPWGKIIGFGVLALFLTLIIAILFSGVGYDVLFAAFLWWIAINGTLAALATLLARGHPISAGVAFSCAWLTSLNPMLAAGWFAAIAEAKIRKPAIADMKAISRADSFSEMSRIPLFRVVLVAALANIGSTLGTFLYFIFIFPLLGIDPTVLITDGFSNIVNTLSGIV